MGINPDNKRVRFNAFVNNVEDVNPIPFNEWVHYAASYDGSFIKIYKNGVLVNQVSAPGSISGNTVSFRIGRQSDVSTSPFYGSIDEVLVFGEALTDQAVNDIYSNGLPVYNHDIAVLTLENESFLVAPADVNMDGKLMNVGSETITNFDLHWSDGTNTYTQNVSGVNIQTHDVYDYSHADILALQPGSDLSLMVWADNPNGLTDDYPSNNNVKGNVLGVGFVPSKRVFVEEGTGTCCGWCPRGTVGLEHMNENYPDDFIAVAIHSGDPMEMVGFPHGFSGFPGARLDRKLSLDPNAAELETQTLQRLEEFTLASIEMDGSYLEATRELTVTLSSQFALPRQSDFRFNLIISEDGITGTGSGYNQANYYSGGANGPMAGYENLPNPIPADQMTYDHVARIFMGGFDGTSNSLPGNVEVGQTYEYSYSYIIPDDFTGENIHLIGLLHDVSNNEIINAVSEPLYDFISNNKQTYLAENAVKIFPNPTSDLTNIQLDLEESANVSLRVLNSVGQEVASRVYGVLSGEMMLPFFTHNLSDGMYFIYLKADEKIAVRKLVVSRN